MLLWQNSYLILDPSVTPKKLTQNKFGNVMEHKHDIL